MSKVQVDTIDTRSGTSTMQIGSTNTSTINIGVSGDTVNIPSGVTIANAGTATGFGGDNDPMFSAKFTGSQSISSATQTKITSFTSEQYDYDSAYDGNRFTVPAGITNQPFFISGVVRCGGIDDGKRLELSVRVNGTEVLNNRTYSSAANKLTGTSISFSQQLSATDYVELYVYHDSGGAQDLAGGYFHVHKLIKG